jgi:dTDP-4-amino-4,6-dideoxygalactose transaminase
MTDKEKRIYLSSPHMGGNELDYIHEAFDTNWIAPLGANVNGFEKDLQNYTGRKHAAVVTSGTAALHLALILCGVKPGDEVICQSFTFAASANPIRYQGATPVFVDSEPETWNMDPELLEQAIVDRMSGEGESGRVDEREQDISSDDFPSSDESKGQRATGSSEGDNPEDSGSKAHRITESDSMSSGTEMNATRQLTGSRQSRKPKAIVIVHLYGMPAKMDRILEIAHKYEIPVIEDAAEALGSTYHGHSCGNFGKFSVLSFNGNKIITTSGGGSLLSDDGELIAKARFLATQARDEAPHYQHSELGYNYRMSNIVAGIGRGQMRVLDDRVMQRRANHDYYFKELGETWFVLADRGSDFARGRDESLSAFSFQLSANRSPTGIYFLREPDGFKSNRWLTTILVNPDETGGVTRDDIRIALEEENIECRPLWKPMHMQPLYKGFQFYSRQPSSAESSQADESKREESSNSSVHLEWIDDGSVSGWLFKYGLCLPSGSNMSEDDRERVVSEIKKILVKGQI